ncbi:hypothetical protein [Streptomyces violaceusniger]|nr:hypothetical protein [Streptomyces violaceusniger]
MSALNKKVATAAMLGVSASAADEWKGASPRRARPHRPLRRPT